MKKMHERRHSFDEEICRQYLNDERDIVTLRNMAAQLPLIADLIDGDVFIDCISDDSDKALVVAEATPKGKRPLYSECPVGKIALRKNEPAALRTLYSGITSRDILGTSQEQFPIHQITVAIWGTLPTPIAVLIWEFGSDSEHIAERKLALIEAASSGFTDAVYSLYTKNIDITERINEAVIVFDQQGIVTFSNKEATNLYRRLGYREPLLGMTFENVALTEESFSECIKKIYELKEVNAGRLVLEVKFFRQSDKAGKADGLCMLIHDITGEKSIERQLRMQSFVISEMNHRIKNNLQMVASILSIQSQMIDDENVRQTFNESINRVLSIASVHDALAVSGESSLNIKELIERICGNIAKIASIQYEIRCDTLYIATDKASAFGLVINELVQNVVKHVEKPDGSEKKVLITVTPGNKYIGVEIEDNGTGFPNYAVEGLGLQLVQRLVSEVLQGKFDLRHGENGTIVSLTFVND